LFINITKLFNGYNHNDNHKVAMIM